VNKICNHIEDELKSQNLYNIPKTTYQDIANYFKVTGNLADENERSMTNKLIKRERDLLSKLAIRLLEIRLAKISSNTNEETNGVNLTPEEKYLTELSSISQKRFDKICRAIIHGHTSILGNVSDLISSKYVVVRFSQSTPSLIGVDLVKYGPFMKEDVAVLPLDNAKPLLKQGRVQELDLEL